MKRPTRTEAEWNLTKERELAIDWVVLELRRALKHTEHYNLSAATWGALNRALRTYRLDAAEIAAEAGYLITAVSATGDRRIERLPLPGA
jgi:hypothetical protein